jgi:hypothetical protein
MNCGQNGIHAGNNVRGTITHSRINRVLNAGILTGGSNSQVNIDETSISFCHIGLQASGGST